MVNAIMAWIDWYWRARKNWTRSTSLYDHVLFDTLGSGRAARDTWMMDVTWTHSTGATKTIPRGRWWWKEKRWGEQLWMDYDG